MKGAQFKEIHNSFSYTVKQASGDVRLQEVLGVEGKEQRGLSLEELKDMTNPKSNLFTTKLLRDLH